MIKVFEGIKMSHSVQRSAPADHRVKVVIAPDGSPYPLTLILKPAVARKMGEQLIGWADHADDLNAIERGDDCASCDARYICEKSPEYQGTRVTIMDLVDKAAKGGCNGDTH